MKKGSVLDILYLVGVSSIVLVLVLLVSWKMTSTLLNITSPMMTPTQTANITQLVTNTTHILDWGFVLVFFATAIISMALAYNIRTSPVFAVFSIFGAVIQVVLAITLHNAYAKATALQVLAGAETTFTAVSWLMSNIVIIAVALVLIQGWVMYSGMNQ